MSGIELNENSLDGPLSRRGVHEEHHLIPTGIGKPPAESEPGVEAAELTMLTFVTTKLTDNEVACDWYI